ncbi:MAG: cell division protein FtsZ [Euryarchaeota archaeon RBG_19FT_COMBO_69_17]|nr:MAG: cell division protein FtsZ [Euryarchaeota archaeon RBG_19FT_COMBO_69_17]
MKSILNEALARHQEEVKEQEKREAQAKAEPKKTDDDAEIEKIVDSINVSIKIVGCGGGGSNTINRCSEAGISGAQMAAINTDAKHLLSVHAPKKILIGKRLTKGLGAGALPEVGEQAAHENEEEIRDFIRGAHVVFITAGMGGGTGTGSAQYVARVAKDEGALTMGVVTMPFKSEGKIRMENAEAGLDKLRKFCDTTIVIYNDKLLELVPRLPINAAFKVADEILMQSIKGMTEIITKPGLVNLDYADLMTIMKGGGVAMIGIGESEEERDRVEYAINEALESPLLGEVDLTHARGALVRVVGGPDLTVSEAERAAEIVGQKINPMSRIIWGCSVDDDLANTIRVLLVITGVKSKSIMGKDIYTGPVATSSDVDEVR